MCVRICTHPLKIWALGLGAYPEVLAEKGYDYVSTSPIKLENRTSAPREITIDEIKEYVQLFAVAARNAVHQAGFDGGEYPIHIRLTGSADSVS